jgi:hypothetical protein
MPNRHLVSIKLDNFWDFAIFSEGMFAILPSSHRSLQAWCKKIAPGKAANCHQMHCRPSKNFRPTFAPSQLLTTPEETGPTGSSLMRASGGLSAILTQINPDGQHCVIAYASRKLQKHESNYMPFLLEMQAAIWGMDHFGTYLQGRKFTLVTDHQPLEKLGKVHTKTLNRLHEVMNTYNFDIIYKKRSEMPADYLSRNLLNAISWDSSTLQQAQNANPLLKALKTFLLNKELPMTPNASHS